jgi:membrane-associated phospholipid phosphatase
VLIVAGLRTGRLAGRLLAAAMAVVVVVVGAALVYLGAHWASDVVTGWVLGVGLGAASGRLLLGSRAARTPDVAGRPSCRDRAALTAMACKTGLVTPREGYQDVGEPQLSGSSGSGRRWCGPARPRR